jgi:transcriptional regulator GlxA family with amidase domain
MKKPPGRTVVEVLALDGALDLALAVTRDVLAAANRLATSRGGEAPFDSRLVAARRHVVTGTGLRVQVDARLADRRTVPDVLVVLGISAPTPPELAAALRRPDVRVAVTAIQAAARVGTLVLAACAGTFLCAEAGLLDGKAAATTWWLAPYFRRRYPNVDLREDRMVVPAAGVVTAGAALAQVDLMLWLVRRVAGPVIADLCSRYLLVDERPSQARYVLVDHLAHRSDEVAAAERFARKSLHRPLGVADLARAAKTSVRTLERRFEEAIGMSPARYLRRLRAERAAHLLATTSRSLADVAEAVGHVDSATLWRILRSELGVSARELRGHGVTTSGVLAK